jgi:hypothetical protein
MELSATVWNMGVSGCNPGCNGNKFALPFDGS